MKRMKKRRKKRSRKSSLTTIISNLIEMCHKRRIISRMKIPMRIMLNKLNLTKKLRIRITKMVKLLH